MNRRVRFASGKLQSLASCDLLGGLSVDANLQRLQWNAPGYPEVQKPAGALGSRSAGAYRAETTSDAVFPVTSVPTWHTDRLPSSPRQSAYDIFRGYGGSIFLPSGQLALLSDIPGHPGEGSSGMIHGTMARDGRRSPGHLLLLHTAASSTGIRAGTRPGAWTGIRYLGRLKGWQMQHEAALSTGSTPEEWARERKERKEKAEKVKRRMARRAQATAIAEMPQDHSTGSGASQEASHTQHLLDRPTNGFIDLMGRPDLIITRRVEWANILLGFEQISTYEVVDFRSMQVVGRVEEKSNWIMRQLLRKRRHFTATVYDHKQDVLFTMDRPFYLISSHLNVLQDGKPLGEVQGRWHLWKRLYDLYEGNMQFAEVRNAGLWWWTFELKGEEGGTLAVVDRNWRGLGLEAFTDAGQYFLRFGPPLSGNSSVSRSAHETPGSMTTNQMLGMQQAAQQIPYLEVSRPLTIAERAVTLAFTISLDTDFFSRHSGRGGWFFPMFGEEI